jgi:formylglycine-generating enzyme required for sulfatase activity/DNA-binding transcriptional MerR regulator
MPPIFPLTPFLLSLSELDIYLTLAEIRRIQQALSAKETWNHRSLKQVLIALIAKSEQQQQDIERLYQRFQQQADARKINENIDTQALQADLQQLLNSKTSDQAPTPQKQDDTKKTPSQKPKKTLLISLLILFSSIIAIVAYKHFTVAEQTKTISEEPATQAETTLNQPQTSEQQQITVTPATNKPEQTAANPTNNTPLYWWLATLLAALTTFWFWKRWQHTKRMPDIPPALAWNEHGESWFDPASIGGEMPAWLSEQILDDCADSIGFYAEETHNGQLDLPATIKATVKAGGLPEVRMQAQQNQQTLLILIDVKAPELHWCPLAYELAKGLRQRGLPVIVGYCYGSFKYFRTDEGELLRLDELAEERGRYITLIFADARVADWKREQAELEELALWPQLSWLTLREPRYWNGREQHLQANGFSLQLAEPDTIIPIFQALAGERVTGKTTSSSAYQRFLPQEPDEPLASYINRVLGDTLPMARIIAVLPPPVSPALMVRLFQQFAPHLPLTRLQRLYALPDTQSTANGLHWSNEVLGILRKQFHIAVQGKKRQHVQDFLTACFNAVKPPNKTDLQYYQWYWRYLRLCMEFAPEKAIPALQALQYSTPLKGQIERDLQQTGIEIPLPDDDANRKRLWSLSAGKAISEAEVWPGLKRYKQAFASGIAATSLLMLLSLGSSFNVGAALAAMLNDGTISGWLGISNAQYKPPEPDETITVTPPKTVIIPAGTFTMGCVEGRDDAVGACNDDEKPTHEVSIASFAMGVYEVTTAEYVTFLNAVGKRGTKDQPWFETEQEDEDKLSYIIEESGKFIAKPGFEQHPALNISWFGAKAYLDWLSEQTGQTWRLPTEAEWEYAARGRSDATYWWGNQAPICDKGAVNGASFNGGDNSTCNNKLANGDWRGAEAVGSFKDNAFGLYDVHGNVWEWTQDCWQNNYENAPVDGAAREGCGALASRVVRGGSWLGEPGFLRSATRINSAPDSRYYGVGFRAARTINPIPSDSQAEDDEIAQNQPSGQPATPSITVKTPKMLKIPAGEFMIPSNSQAEDDEVAQNQSSEQVSTPSITVIIPEMIKIPAGEFMMGCDEKRDDVEGGCSDDEKPAHQVTISKDFSIGKYEVTFDEWDACEQAKVCPHADDEGWGRGKRPVINVSWDDAQTYIKWLNQQTGKNYRLPTEAEWEYAARADTNTAYPWGNNISCENADFWPGWLNGGSCNGKGTSLVGSYQPNTFGLYDTVGNVWEWTADRFAKYSAGAVTDPVSTASGSFRVVRSGGWGSGGRYVRSAIRNHYSPGDRFSYIGFRLALGH